VNGRLIHLERIPTLITGSRAIRIGKALSGFVNREKAEFSALLKDNAARRGGQ
jgi:hypothetical protein